MGNHRESGQNRHTAPLSIYERMPRGLREQPAWIFIGVMFIVVGVGYLTGYTDSSISKAIGAAGLQLWGVSMIVSGLLKVTAAISASPPYEKFALRFMSINILAYMGWLLTVVPIQKAASAIVLGMSLVVIAEFRVLTLKSLIRKAEQLDDILKVMKRHDD